MKKLLVLVLAGVIACGISIGCSKPAAPANTAGTAAVPATPADKPATPPADAPK